MRLPITPLFFLILGVGVVFYCEGRKSSLEEELGRPPIHVVYSADDKMKPGVEASIRLVIWWWWW